MRPLPILGVSSICAAVGCFDPGRPNDSGASTEVVGDSEPTRETFLPCSGESGVSLEGHCTAHPSTSSSAQETTVIDEGSDSFIADESEGSDIPLSPNNDSICGDGKIEPPETCDDGVNDGAYGGCLLDCSARAPYCGDGVVNGPETCDDGNAEDDERCSSRCRVPGDILAVTAFIGYVTKLLVRHDGLVLALGSDSQVSGRHARITLFRDDQVDMVRSFDDVDGGTSALSDAAVFPDNRLVAVGDAVFPDTRDETAGTSAWIVWLDPQLQIERSVGHVNSGYAHALALGEHGISMLTGVRARGQPRLAVGYDFLGEGPMFEVAYSATDPAFDFLEPSHDPPGFIVLGTDLRRGSGSAYMLFSQTGTRLRTFSLYTLDSVDDHYISDSLHLPDGTVVLSGSSQQGPWLIGYGPEGNVKVPLYLHQQDGSGGFSSLAYDRTDGGIVAVGSLSIVSGQRRLLLKLDSTGNLLWQVEIPERLEPDTTCTTEHNNLLVSVRHDGDAVVVAPVLCDTEAGGIRENRLIRFTG